MKQSRRGVLQGGGAAGLYAALVGIGFLKPGTAEASAFDKAFTLKGVKEGMEAIGAGGAEVSDKVVISAPDIAENGAVVPVGIRSDLPSTEMIALFVEKNPFALTGAYDILPGAAASVSMRIKMGQSSDVFAVVKAGGKYYMAKKEIKVTLGGCGG